MRDAAAASLALRTVGWDVAIIDGEPGLIEGKVPWNPAYESAVGGEILEAIRADGSRQGAVSSLQPAVSK
jgi:hypothetical protein